MSETILQAKGIVKKFGGLTAVNDVSFDVRKGCIKAVIGPNGAGKTTIFNIIAGALAPTAGSFIFKGRDITGLKPHLVAAAGIGRTFQNVKIFKNMTALENVMLARHCATKTGFIGAMLRLPHAVIEERRSYQRSMEYLDFVGLARHADFMAPNLPFGEQKILEVARALALDPVLLLLDEPAAGLNTRETAGMADLICRIRDTGVTVLLVEHDMSLVMEISDEVHVLDFGCTVTEGPPREVQNNPDVIRIYLGQDFEPVEKK